MGNQCECAGYISISPVSQNQCVGREIANGERGGLMTELI
jgi:hypothetical protein